MSFTDSLDRFLGEKLKLGGLMMSPEEALDEWRELHPEPIAEDDLAAIKEALDDVDNGDVGIPYEEFDREFRKRMDLPTSEVKPNVCPKCGTSICPPDFLVGSWHGSKANGVDAGGGIFKLDCECGAILESYEDLYDADGRLRKSDDGFVLLYWRECESS